MTRKKLARIAFAFSSVYTTLLIVTTPLLEIKWDTVKLILLGTMYSASLLTVYLTYKGYKSHE
jgi:hypothetical protein